MENYFKGMTRHKGKSYYYSAKNTCTTDDSYYVSVKIDDWKEVVCTLTLDDLATDIEFIHGIRVSYITGRD